MSINSAEWLRSFIVSLVVLSLFLVKEDAFAAFTDNPSLDIQHTIGKADACRAGLKFGIRADHIPIECNAYLIKTLTSATSYKEKWRYRGGYLFFDNGVLMAIRQMNR
jgi:hypothetical protein